MLENILTGEGAAVTVVDTFAGELHQHFLRILQSFSHILNAFQIASGSEEHLPSRGTAVDAAMQVFMPSHPWPQTPPTF
jgi:hypothetical protein